MSGLRRALRTEHSVRLAVLFGSTATGEDLPDSDVDLLVEHSTGNLDQVVELRRRLQERVGKPVHLVLLEDAEQSPSLLADVLIEGRASQRPAEGSTTDGQGCGAWRFGGTAARDERPEAPRAHPREDLRRSRAAPGRNSRGLAEGQRLGALPKGPGRPWDCLAEFRVISRASATRLQNVKDMRNELAHAYPPVSWRALHQATETLLAELDSYKVKVSDWLDDRGILPQ